MVQASDLAEALGGRHVLKADIDSIQELLRLTDSGLPYASLDALVDRFDLPGSGVSHALGLSPGALARRKRKRRLRPNDADRLVRVARIACEAARVLGGDDKAGAWLQRPNVALGGTVPMDLLSTDLGSREVENVLGRIEFGVYS